MIKHVNLTVFSSNTPYELTIATCNGQFIARRTVSSNPTSFCLCTNACCIKLIAKYQNETITKTTNLPNCFCQNLSAVFNFSPPTPQPLTQVFTLTDKNYNLPVKNAVLNFEN